MGLQPPKPLTYRRFALAIDFETANELPHSACAMGAALVKGDEIIDRVEARFRPYTGDYFRFTHIHGIRWGDVRDLPTFEAVWPTFQPLWEKGQLLLAHNAPFDLRVLFATCRRASVVPEPRWYACTLAISRKTWPEFSDHKLSTVCRNLGLSLNHHDALADAIGCASIYIASAKLNPRVQATAVAGWTETSLPTVIRPGTHNLTGRVNARKAEAARPLAPVTTQKVESRLGRALRWLIGQQER